MDSRSWYATETIYNYYGSSDADRNLENSADMEQVQFVQPLACRSPSNVRKNIFPAEMDSKICFKSIPWRDHSREAMDEDVPSDDSLSRPNGSFISSET